MFELQILFGNIVAPAAILLFSWLACAAIPATHRSRWTTVVLGLSSSIAIWTALAVRNGFAWWPEDAWQKVPIAALIVLFTTIIAELFRSKLLQPDVTEQNSFEQNSSNEANANPVVINKPAALPNSVHPTSTASIVQWIAITVGALAAAWLIFPRGDSWAELQSEQNQWCLVIALSASLAWWGIAGCRPVVAITVAFATISLLIASAFLTSLSIMKITEPLIAVATVIGLCSLIALRLGGLKASSQHPHRPSLLPMMLAPTLFTKASFIAHASFQSYLGLPRTLYFLAMLSPAIVALVARMSQRKSTGVAIAATISVALILAASLAAWTYVAGEVGAEPEW